MGSAERIRVAARLATEQNAVRPVAVVVSAMSKITDLLLDTLRKAEAGDQTDVDSNLWQLSSRHVETCCALLPHDRQASGDRGHRSPDSGIHPHRQGHDDAGRAPSAVGG